MGGESKYRRSSTSAEIERFLSTCRKRGLRITPQRRLIVETLLEAQDHPDAATLHQRVRRKDSSISAATVYRTLNLLEAGGILVRHDFQTHLQGSSSARYELAGEHHDHLIDLQNGTVVEFYDKELEEQQERIAAKLGFRLVNHHMILYGVPKKAGRAGKQGASHKATGHKVASHKATGHKVASHKATGHKADKPHKPRKPRKATGQK